MVCRVVRPDTLTFKCVDVPLPSAVLQVTLVVKGPDLTLEDTLVTKSEIRERPPIKLRTSKEPTFISIEGSLPVIMTKAMSPASQSLLPDLLEMPSEPNATPQAIQKPTM